MTLLVKDANTTTQSISTQVDTAGNLVPVHAPAAIAGGVATPVGPTAPLPVINAAGSAVIGGVLFVIVETMLRNKKGSDNITWNVAIAVGLGQLIAAIFPGASRSGTTILLALLLGVNRPLATEFSFLVGIPTMLAASGLKIFKALHHPASDAPHEDWAMVILCSVVAAVVSFIAVKWLLSYIQTHTFIAFGWYRIVVGGALLVLVLTHVMSDKTEIPHGALTPPAHSAVQPAAG